MSALSELLNRRITEKHGDTSNRQLVEMAGVSRGTIDNYRKGDHPAVPGEDVLSAFHDLTGLSMQELRGHRSSSWRERAVRATRRGQLTDALTTHVRVGGDGLFRPQDQAGLRERANTVAVRLDAVKERLNEVSAGERSKKTRRADPFTARDESADARSGWYWSIDFGVRLAATANLPVFVHEKIPAPSEKAAMTHFVKTRRGLGFRLSRPPDDGLITARRGDEEVVARPVVPRSDSNWLMAKATMKPVPDSIEGLAPEAVADPEDYGLAANRGEKGPREDRE